MMEARDDREGDPASHIDKFLRHSWFLFEVMFKSMAYQTNGVHRSKRLSSGFRADLVKLVQSMVSCTKALMRHLLGPHG